MSVQAISWVLEHSESTGTARLVLIAIANHLSDHDGDLVCWPSVATLARESRVSERAVQYGIRDLSALGELKVEKRRARTTLYRVPGVGGAKSAPPQNLHPEGSAPEPKSSRGLGSSTASASSHLNGHKRAKDPIWDGFVAWLGRSPATRSERSKWNAAAKELREIGVDSATEVERRGREYQRIHPTWEPTPNALAAHWSEFSPRPVAPEPLDLARVFAWPDAAEAYLAGDYDRAREVLRNV